MDIQLQLDITTTKLQLQLGNENESPAPIEKLPTESPAPTGRFDQDLQFPTESPVPTRNPNNRTIPKPTKILTNHVRVHAAHDHEHDCYNSFTLYRGCTHSP
jgi:hypothetical protein